MKESIIEAKVHQLCFGNEKCSPDFLSYSNQFLLWLNKLEDSYTLIPHEAAPLGSSAEVLVLAQTLHRQDAIIFVRDGSIEKDLLIRKDICVTNPISGRTLLCNAKDVICNCKKTQALVTALSSPYKNRTFPSGTNFDDYAKWCLDAMFQDQQRNKDTIDGDDNVQEDDVGQDAANRSSNNDEEDAEQGSGDSEDNNPNTEAPKSYMWRGYMAWLLWGYMIPIFETATPIKCLFIYRSKGGYIIWKGYSWWFTSCNEKGSS